MEIAEKQKIQIIALQETKLNEKYNLKYKNYNILRKDRNKEGGGLAFLIKNLYYEDIAINIPNTSDLEAQGIKIYLNQNKTINIFNMYHPPNNKLIDDETTLQTLTDNTIIVGDLNAKHQLWGCSTPNPRGKILSNLFDDNAYMCLNDGNPTHHSYSYNTAQALDISFSSPDIFHKCKWQILKSIGSDHLPILIEISTKTKTSLIKEKFWNFKKADWNLYQQNTNEDFRKAPTRIKDLEQNWISFKNTIIKAAKVSIPRGNIKKWIPNYTHQAKDIQTLITKRNELQKKAQPQTENTNMIKNIDGTPATNDKNAANLLGNSYQISSKIKFEIKDKKVEKKARKIIHDCKNVTSTHNIFHEKINMEELDYALENTDLNKTPGPDGIHGQMISNLGKNGKEKLLDVFNNSWKTGKLPQDWKTATIITIKKLDKSANDPKNYRPISLTSICCKLMEKIILRRLTYHLDTRNLLPEEQYGFRKGHGTIDQLLFFTQKVKDAQNRKPTNHTIAAFLDLTQAFDKGPILEYGYQIYGTASETNLKSLERIQLSAARIITGLRNTCPNDIVLYEADIMPLKDRRSYNLPKYINKIKSYGNKHRTSKYILNWESNLRLKKEGPLHLAKRNGFLKYEVEKNYLAEKISPCEPLQNVIFNDTLNEPTNKQYQNPEYLKQLSLEIINNIPKNAITIYTDGSRDELGHTGSGCLIKTTNGIEKMNRRNPDFCSVFRSELIAIYEALKSIRNTNYQDIWILTDSRSAIQHLSHTGELRDKVSRNIIVYLQKLSKTSKIHLQWIPSHVGIEGNEAADVLAKKGTKELLPQKNKLTFKEIETIAKTKINKNWRIPPKHSWYSEVNPGGALNIRNRQHQTTLTRFRTGHLKPLKIENNNKIYPTCPKCSLSPAAPEHILACIRCTKQDLWERPLLIIKQLEEHELMEFVQYETFRETCAALGLLENDNHWVVTMDEAVLCQAPTRVRQLFAILISTCTISNPQQLWITYRDEMASDILHRYQLLDSSIRYNDPIYNETLCNIEDRVVSICGKKLQELGLGAPRRNVVTNSDILRELAYDTAELEDNVASMLPKLLPEQRRVFDAVLAKINLSQPIIIFLDAPGGTAVSCWFGMRIALEALDRTLQDIRDDPQPMGGLVVLLAGDFRQTLPVVTRGTPADELNACLKSSYLWSHIVKMHLTVNMRVQLHNDTTAAQFADELLKIGEGQLETDSEGNIQFSNTFCQVVESSESLYEKVFPNIGVNYLSEEWLCARTILAPKNSTHTHTVLEINNTILNSIPGESKIYRSIDTMVDPDESVSYPPEFLNSLELSGTPSHKIVLKVGVPVILIRNLDPPRLCNGTRLCITQMGTNVLQARILTGSFRGEEVLIPRIPIIPNDLPFKFRRLQFPVMVAFAMTINKSQGQTLQNQRQIMTFVLSFGSTFWLPLPIQMPFHYSLSQHGQGSNVECSYSPMVPVGDGWLRHTSRAFQIAVSSQVKFDEICPAPSLILMFVPSCSIMLIPAPPLLRVRSEDPSVYAVKGRGLAFLINNLYYEDIAVNIPNTLDLETQGIKVFLNQNKAINIYNITHNIFHEKKINMKELAYALENTDLNKTPGPDGIHGRMISNLGKIGKERLLNIFNNSWKTGKLPQDCKNATIIPIKKLDKSADDPKNYRPISLTNICCKLMEKIIFRRLTYHPDTRNLLPEEQYGFRKGHGTIVQLLFFTQKKRKRPTKNPEKISGREWGADATTLKLTYTSLIRPILEYGYQIYGTASETNLKSLERIQLSAARIITGLRNTCPNDIVLYEADIMPLKDRRSYNLPKYINKIKSYGNKHRTSKYILNWESNLRLKKEGPLHLAKRNGFLKYEVEKNYLAEKISPCEPLQNVIFNDTLNEPTNKQYQNPEYLKQLSLEIINNIPKNAITIYTDGSRDELGHTGSGCLIKTTNGIEKMNRRNPDFCSVFRSELIAIYEALKSIRNTNYQDIWILTDSRSAIQHLSHTGELRDKVSRNIIVYLQKLSKTSKIHLQWIPSHVGIEGNEAADVLAKKGTKELLPQKNKLTFKEIETIAKTKINKNWRIPPKHSWYSEVNPGGALNIRNRQHQTTLTRFRTGHLKPLKIENNNKIYPTCPKCSLSPAAPEHILACIRCTKQDLWERPLLIIKQLEEHELMEFVQYETFRETCAALGLLENDNHWVVTMDEAVLCQAPTRVRQLFAILISTCTISNPQQLWITYRDEMASDILHRYQLLDSSIRYNDLIYNETLCNIEDRVVSICGKKLQELGLGAPRRNVVTNSDILRELAYDTAELEDNVASMLPKLLPEQRRVFDAVLAKINLSQPIIIFLDAPGGTAVSCWFGMRIALEALDRTLQDIRDDPQPMGGLVVLLAGDFRQTLPVVTRGTPADELNACLKSSYLWSHIVKMHLTVNMRVQLHNDTTAAQFADELLKIGEGQLETDSEGNIQFSNTFCQVVESSESLYEKVFPNIGVNYLSEEWLCARTILAPKNSTHTHTVLEINNTILNSIPGESKIYRSIDTMVDPDESVSYPPEFLNSLELSGTPSHKIVLKVGVPVILIRNLDPPRLCNGTRLCITQMGTNVLQARILTGSFRGEEVLIPRIPIIPNDLPFKFRRLQFPVMVAFAMTINKSQGQTLQVVGNSYQISSKIKVEKRPERLFMTVKMSPALIIFSMKKKINMKELAYALENTDLNKTPGPDGIHGRMISNLGKIGKERLLNIFNNSWKTGKLPQDCKNATIIPIKKLDKSADDPKNYRPISLTNICCKLMEKIIFRRLTYHPDTRNLLPEEQYGFRKGHGTIVQLLFFTQKGPTSFAYLKIVNCSQYETFRETCAALGLLENDNHWVVTMDEAVLCQAPTRVRQLFAILISTCTISNPQQLWITYRDEMASDILHRYQLLDSSIRYNDLIYNETLCNIEDRVVSICGKKLQELGLGAPRRNVVTNSDILRELAYDTAELEDNVASMLPKLLPEQRRVFDAVLAKINLSQPIIIFLDALGGTAVSCWFGMRIALEALDRTLQDIRDDPQPMGGLVVLLAGDFRQTLPVVTRGTPADELNACLKSSYLWSHIVKMHLTVNMRVQLHNDTTAAQFADELLKIGEGQLETDSEGNIQFSNTFCQVVESSESLYEKVFPNIGVNYLSEEWLCARTILAPKNSTHTHTVLEINNTILNSIPGESKIYRSIDTMVDPDESVSYPPEFLNSLELSGTPSHKIVLKVGVPVILIRNLDPPRLCNGTRLCITQMGTNVLQARILTGSFRGEEVLIPRIPIIPNDLPFKFRRLQFPVMVAFAMTINKSQGQTLQNQRQIMTFVLSFGSTFWLPLPIQMPFHYSLSQHGQGSNVECSYSPMVPVGDGWLRHTSRAFQIAVSSQVKFDEICPAPSLILMFVPSCSIMLIPAPPLLRVRSEDPSVYAVKGRGLAFLINNLYYEDIAVNIPNTLDLETQGIKVFLNQNKAINIYNITHNIFHEKKINMKELAYALENTDLNKTPGPDGIHGRMISNLGKIGKERLLNIFNNSWKTGKLPQDCKNATIIPIKKLDKSADDPKNYRPISLTNICCKLMEKIIFRRLTYHPDTRNLLPEEQYGFRKGHGTIVQLLFFTQKKRKRPTKNPEKISGREWGADATTLKLTYTSLIRPILEYGYQIYGTASETNLKSLERIQLSAARIITGLLNTCPNDIVLYEADIMPLKDRRSYNLPKYINKIKSYGNKHRTSKYILNWESNLRLKKEGPLHLAKRNGFLKYEVEKNYLAEKISPCEPLQNVIFNDTLNEPTNKQYQNPEYLKQLSLEIINNIPKNAITIYTDGSRDELGHTGSGCLIKTTNGIEKMNRRNPDFCSVFRSELIAIYEALKSIRNTNYQDIWILTDSRSAIQHLSHTGELRDKVSRNIIVYLQKLSKTSKIHLQWIPSHVGIEGNEAADVLAKKGTKELLPQKNKLTFKEIETIAETKINKNWRIPPKHSWYSEVNPGGALNIRNRQHQTTLTRFRTGHLKPLKIENNNKIYPTCPKCSLSPAAPEHILACIRCTKQDLWERPLLIIKQLEEHELMEFVRFEGFQQAGLQLIRGLQGTQGGEPGITKGTIRTVSRRTSERDGMPKDGFSRPCLTHFKAVVLPSYLMVVYPTIMLTATLVNSAVLVVPR
ncbi:hypothetical protein LAZ67_18002138, partial [Cordylochernes scorpioides]